MQYIAAFLLTPMNTSVAPAVSHDQPEPIWARPLRADQITQLYATAPIGYIGSVIATLGAITLLRGEASTERILIWIAATLLVAIARGILSWRFARCPNEQKSDVRWMRRFQVSAFAGGFGWGLGGALMFIPDSPQHQMLLLMLLLGMVTAGVYSYAIHLPTFLWYMAPIVIGALIGQVSGMDPKWRSYTIFSTLLYAAASIMFARLLSRSLTNAIALKHQNAALVTELQKKSALAEQASLAKSRFLAAASHDLRQPVHALGLFLASLSRTALPSSARCTITDMEACIAATGDLFSSILDISRLDAGIIKPVPSLIAVAPFARRIITEYQAMSREKGLVFRFRLSRSTEQAYILTDPQLLERILRNLLQNAVRYTEKGSILMTMRKCENCILIQVADTGCGIPNECLDDAFEEFVQLKSSTREQRQGLGLGLSIVKRLCTLLDFQIRVASRIDRGSCFCLSIPLAKETPAIAERQAGMADHLSLEGRFIVVLDDDPVIVRALESLLIAWGADVHGQHALEELLVASATFDRCPDLIISDFYLQRASHRHSTHVDGIGAIAQLRDEFAKTIPAILITGETDPRQLRMAHSSGLVVLHKPLHPSALATHLATIFDYQPAARAASTA
jgi:signal transduction histidine kinase/CheY-like chemotaxis protein